VTDTLKLNQEQYKTLIKCSNNNDIGAWNKFVENLPEGYKIELEGADLRKKYLVGAKFDYANMKGVKLYGSNLERSSFRYANLQEAELTHAQLSFSDFFKADLRNVILPSAIIQNAKMVGADIRGGWLSNSILSGTCFNTAKMNKCQLDGAIIQNGEFLMTDLSGAYIQGNLEGCLFERTKLKQANFQSSICDSMLFTKCEIDHKTDFRVVNLDSIRFEPGVKQVIEYHNRLLNWEDWYKQHKILKYPTKLFWEISDYGFSTIRVINTFLILSVLFTFIYLISYYTGNAFLNGFEKDGLTFGHYLIRSFYFSIVTMTTLGFGDIYANPQSIIGHILLMIQVIMGYVILGGLVTRLSILFNADGPSAPKPNKEQSHRKSKNK